MNKEYIYHDGNVILEDEKGNRKPIEYRDNLDEILIQENIIETMENEIEKLTIKSNGHAESIKWEKILAFTPFVSFLLVPSIVITILFSLSNASNVVTNTIFGTMKESTALSIGLTAFFAPLGAALSGIYYAGYRQSIKNENARKASIEYLNGALEKAKEDLNEMKKQKTEENKRKGFRIVKINDNEQIRKLYGRINLYYDCGYNGQKYYRYYQKHNKLPKKVENNYTELGRELVKEYLEEKGPTLVKRRVSQKTGNNL